MYGVLCDAHSTALGSRDQQTVALAYNCNTSQIKVVQSDIACKDSIELHASKNV